MNTTPYDIYCDRCNNIMNITRTIPRHDDTPVAISSSHEPVDYEQMLRKVEADQPLTVAEISQIDIKEMTKDEYYMKMQNKGKIKKKITDMIEDIDNTDDMTQSYMICKNCAYNKPITQGVRIMSMNPEGVVATHDYADEANYRCKVHVRTMPCTRNFICTNKQCATVTERAVNEAVFFRKNQHSHETVYVCKRCLDVRIV
jgi:hypothetical protein